MEQGVLLFALSLLAMGCIGLLIDDDWDNDNDDDDTGGDGPEDQNITVTGEDPDVKIQTGDGNDTITTAEGSPSLKSATIDTGAGNDTIEFDVYVDAVDIDTGAGDDNVSLQAIDNGTVVTGSGDDTVVASAGYFGTFKLGEGDDEIKISGGPATSVSGDAGDDTITITGYGTAFGGDGDDIIKTSNFFADGSNDVGYVDGDTGNDTLDLDGGPLIRYEGGTAAADMIKPILGGEGADKFVIHTGNISSDIITNFIDVKEGDAPEPDSGYAMTYDAANGTVGTSFATIGDFEPGTDMISLDVSVTDGFTFTSAKIIPISSDTNVTDRPDYADDDSELSHIDLYFKNADATITQKLTMSVYHKAGTDIDPDDILFLGAEPRDGIEAVIA